MPAMVRPRHALRQRRSTGLQDPDEIRV